MGDPDTIEVDREDLRSMLIYAYRYGIGRRSYAVGEVVDMLARYGPGLLSAHDWRLTAKDTLWARDDVSTAWMVAMADAAGRAGDE